MGVAVGLPGHAVLSRPRDRLASPASFTRVRPPARRQASRVARRHREAGHSAHAPAFVRHASARRRPRHPHRARAPGPPRRHDDADLHARPQPWPVRGAKPDRYDMGRLRLGCSSPWIIQRTIPRVIQQPGAGWRGNGEHAQVGASYGQSRVVGQKHGRMAARDISRRRVAGGGIH